MGGSIYRVAGERVHGRDPGLPAVVEYVAVDRILRRQVERDAIPGRVIAAGIDIDREARNEIGSRIGQAQRSAAAGHAVDRAALEVAAARVPLDISAGE